MCSFGFIADLCLGLVCCFLYIDYINYIHISNIYTYDPSTLRDPRRVTVHVKFKLEVWRQRRTAKCIIYNTKRAGGSNNLGPFSRTDRFVRSAYVLG